MKKILGLSLLWLLTAPAFAQSVYYSNNDDHPTEVAAAAASLASTLGGTATAFNASSDAEWSTALASATHIFVGQGAGLDGLAGGTVTDATNWVAAGGALLLLGGSSNTETMPFLNAVTGASMSTGACESSSSTKVPAKTIDVDGTSFDSAPATISAAVSNWCAISLASLSGTGIPAYLDQADDVHVLLEPIGSGSVAYFSWDFCCSADTAERDGWQAALVAAATFDGDAAMGIARFRVTKTFSDGRDDEVDVHLSCNSGLPLEQDFTISGGGEGVLFVITELQGTETVCEVTESGGPAGYTPVLNGGDGCTWEGVTGGLFICEITNEADPAEFTVTKDWVIEGAVGEEVLLEAQVTINCTSDILTIDGFVIPEPDGSVTDFLSGDGDSVTVTVDTTLGSTSCSASESIFQTGVESTDNCGSRSIAAGGSSSCTITNTVFFEGIPTLSQYGMALMALLMLGLGFVGLRRFV